MFQGLDRLWLDEEEGSKENERQMITNLFDMISLKRRQNKGEYLYTCTAMMKVKTLLWRNLE